MGDEGFDPCECYWVSQFRMQRLLSLLRQTQSYCSDTECLNISRLSGPGEPVSQTDFLTIFLIIGAMTLLYMFRPSSMRSSRTAVKSNEVEDFDNEPPGPPPATN